MIKIKYAAVAVCAVAALSFVACKSTPEPEAPAVEEIVEEQIEETVEEIQEEVDYSDANQKLLEQAEAARQAAIDAGADKTNPLAYKAAEAEYESLKALIETGADCSKALKDLEARYSALAAIARAEQKKDRIEKLAYESYDKASYDKGCSLLETLKQDNKVIVLSKFKADAAECEASFDKVLDTAFRALAKEERTRAFVAKKSADDVKAAVSRKAEYDKGVDAFKAGDSAYVTKNPERALNSYTTSKDIFTKLAEEISEARAKAQAAVDAAKKRVAQSESIAENADVEKPLGDEPVEGIEAEETQLLEADDFSAAESAAVELEAELPEDNSETK